MKNAIVDFRISEEEINNLKKLNLNILKCPKCEILYDAVCGHPDMQIHVLDKTNVLVHKGMDKNLINELVKLGISITFSNRELKGGYPDNIILNAVSLKNYFIHNLKYTDEILYNNRKDSIIINVKQGYTKCSTAVLSEKAIMTSDVSIAKRLVNYHIDILLLPPGDIELPGVNYGFIGGCCGLIDEHHMAFFGDLDYYAYKNDVAQFLKKHKIAPLFLRKGRLIDRGSLFIL